MAQVSILVKTEGVVSKVFNPFGTLISAVKKEKDKVIIAFDDVENTSVIEAADKPYVFDVAPGAHTLYVQDWKGLSKHTKGTVLRAAVSAGMGLMTGSVMNNISESLNKSAEKLEREMWSTIDFTIRNTQTIHFACKATTKGTVKITQMD